MTPASSTAAPPGAAGTNGATGATAATSAPPNDAAGVPSTPGATAAEAQSHVRTRPMGRPRGLRLGRGREGTDFTLADSVARATQVRPYERTVGEPLYRPLRIFALDPAASSRDGAVAVVNVPYERLEGGPRGALLDVVADDAPGSATGDAAPVGALDLDDRAVLLQQGRTPSSSDPLFRRQMVYAVCSTTYAAFRHALGRDLSWGFDRPTADGEPARLVVRPEALDVRNAYYDRSSGQLRFGVFAADAVVAGRNAPHGTVSTCLSHDVVVHEMSHALLDGLRSRFLLPSNPDVLAFHEAFSDVVAVLQRFTYADVVRAGIRQARGDVRVATLLTGVATQFGQTIGLGGPLRRAAGGKAHVYGEATEPHERSEVLLAAVFEAFATIYDRKTAPLVRLATNGTGVLPPGEIPDLLADRLTRVACKLASQFLTICIRAIDYCPPVDVTFGEYLRAVITADYDLVPDDDLGYREAWIDAFWKYRIYPEGVTSLTEDALLWRAPDAAVPPEPALGFDRLQFCGDPGRPASAAELRRQAAALGALVADPQYCRTFGLLPLDDAGLQGDTVRLPVVESVRASRRAGPDGQIAFDLIGEVTQRRLVRPHAGAPGFEFFGGATVILGPNGVVRYVVRKSVGAQSRIERHRAFVAEETPFWKTDATNMRRPVPDALRLLHDAGPRTTR